MRVELRVEQDEHEYAVTVECDQSVATSRAVDIVRDAVRGLMSRPIEEVLHP